MNRDLLSIILDALYAFEDTIKGGDRHWGSYPAPTNNPEATLRTYLGDIIEARKVVVALMPGPRLSPEIRQAMHRVLDEIEGTPDGELNPDERKAVALIDGEPHETEDEGDDTGNLLSVNREVTATSDETQAAFLTAAAAMNTFALLAHNDPGVDARLAEGINDRQQWLASCDWPILGYDTSDPPADPTT